jgi:hypothetical protein
VKVAATVAAVLLALLAGCGAPDKLSREDAAKLANARERLDGALDTEAALSTSQRKVRRIRAEVRRIVSGGSLEADELDEFGLAALGELQQVVPSVVETDVDGVPTDLDRPALRTFLRYAGTDPPRALLGPATDEVESIQSTIEDSGADGETKVGEETVAEYLRAAERDVKPIWPELAERLGNVL